MRFLAVLLLFLAPSADAQRARTYLKQRLLKQPLYLRGMWSADDLHFDKTGHPLTGSETTSFTLSGIEVRKLDIQPDRLILTARRIGLELDESGAKRVVLTRGQGRAAKEVVVRIEIDAEPGGDYSDALDAIFTAKLEDLAPNLPPCWQIYAARAILHDPSPRAFTYGDPPREVTRDVTEPIIRSANAEFTEYARSLAYKGTVQVQFTVGKDGRPSSYIIVKPLGLGLDEAAIESIRQYVFGPATLHGKTIAVTLTIEVTFDIR
jgi:TonB family protein